MRHTHRQRAHQFYMSTKAKPIRSHAIHPTKFETENFNRKLLSLLFCCCCTLVGEPATFYLDQACHFQTQIIIVYQSKLTIIVIRARN